VVPEHLKEEALRAAFTKKVVGPYVYALFVNSKNGIFAVDPEDSAVGLQLRMEGQYGLKELERLERYITPDSTVLFVGAHIGTFVVPISKVCKKVIAIEANPATYDLLMMNLALNSVSNCRAINIAASDREESIEFLMNRANSGGSKRVPIVNNIIYYYDNPQKITIEAVSLDNYLSEKSFELVVMDIEGSEYFALKGMQQILANSKVLSVEFLPHHLKNVSGVSVEQFLSVIEPHFSKLTIPSKQLQLNAGEFVTHLRYMYDHEQGDEGIVFEKG
jgi:FkbM family methyltransferase